MIFKLLWFFGVSSSYEDGEREDDFHVPLERMICYQADVQTPGRHVHFIGIGGTAMGNVAVMMHKAGFKVTGSDERVYPPMSRILAENEIRYFEGYAPANLSQKPDLIVVGNAISRGNAELEEVLDSGLRYCSLPELLRNTFLWHCRNIIVSGTHGKTTTSSMVAHILKYAGKDPSYLIGGAPADLGTGGHFSGGKIWVLEGDEYDTAFFDKRSKFLHYLPETVIINNIEFDHADIFSSLSEIETTFRRLVALVPRRGMILVNADDPVAVRVTEKSLAPVNEVGFSPNAAMRISEFSDGPQGVRFEIIGQQVRLRLHGEHNARNAAMALMAAHSYGVDLSLGAEALAAFRGVERRQEVVVDEGGITVVDDFGHHPTAIRATIRAVRARYPGRRIWALFEPRSNTTRRAVFQKELPTALAEADGVYLSQVARLEQLSPGERLDPERVVAEITAAGREAHYCPGADEIVAHLRQRLQQGDVILILSNGSFDGIRGKLANLVKSLSTRS